MLRATASRPLQQREPECRSRRKGRSAATRDNRDERVVEEGRLAQRAVDQVRRDKWNAHARSRTKTGK